MLVKQASAHTRKVTCDMTLDRLLALTVTCHRGRTTYTSGSLCLLCQEWSPYHVNSKMPSVVQRIALQQETVILFTNNLPLHQMILHLRTLKL